MKFSGVIGVCVEGAHKKSVCCPITRTEVRASPPPPGKFREKCKYPFLTPLECPNRIKIYDGPTLIFDEQFIFDTTLPLKYPPGRNMKSESMCVYHCTFCKNKNSHTNLTIHKFCKNKNSHSNLTIHK